MLQDLIIAAVNQAIAKAQELHAERDAVGDRGGHRTSPASSR